MPATPLPTQPTDAAALSGAGASDATRRSRDALTDAVVATIQGTDDARLKQVVTSLIRHVHSFIRDVEPTEDEWNAGLDFLAEVGRMCDDKRQEFNLLSDILGATMMVDLVSHPTPDATTESSVPGPFYRHGAPVLAPGATISMDAAGDPVVVSGRVTDPAGAPIEGAILDIWQSSSTGLYENQDAAQPDMNLRGRFQTDADGHYHFRTVKPASYPIPHDGPAGQLLRQLNRHPYRPAHIHFKVSAPGYTPLTTQIFVRGDDYIESDAVFGVKDSLVVDFRRVEGTGDTPGDGSSGAVYAVNYDFRLRPATR